MKLCLEISSKNLKLLMAKTCMCVYFSNLQELLAYLTNKVSFHSNILLGIKQALLTRWQATSKQFIANLNSFLFHPKEKYNNFTNSGKMTPVENDCSIQFWFFLHTTSTLNQTMQAITYTYQHTQDVWIPLWFTSVVFLTSEKLFHVEKSHFC